MKTCYQAILMFCAIGTILVSTGAGQDTNEQNRRKPQEQQDQQEKENANRAGNLDPKTAGANIRASYLIGSNIQNPSGENLGEINDIVIETRDGKLRYVAVTYGGFLGIGNDMHAVPFEALRFRPASDDASETVIVLNVTQKQLEGAKGFNENNWPSFADEEFTREVDKRYGVDRSRDETEGGIYTGTDRRDTWASTYRASKLTGMNIQNSSNENVGEIYDIVVNALDAKVRYFAVTYGGFLGIGNDLHAVPFEAFHFRANPNDPSEMIIVLDVTQEQLKDAEGFNETTWPNFADDEFVREIDKRYRIDRKRSDRDRSDQENDNDG